MCRAHPSIHLADNTEATEASLMWADTAGDITALARLLYTHPALAAWRCLPLRCSVGLPAMHDERPHYDHNSLRQPLPEFA